MKKLLVIGISAVLMITLTAGVLAESLLGREVVEKGETVTLSGTLVAEDGEWYLESGQELVQIHLGNQAYLDSIGLELTAGGKAEVYGFLEGSEIAPITVTVGSDEYRLRDESGFPLWAGAGERRNALNDGRRDDSGRGMGRNQAARIDNCDCSGEG